MNLVGRLREYKVSILILSDLLICDIVDISEEDTTVESSQGNSLIHMSVVDKSGGNGARRSSVVMIEHVDMTPVPSADLDNNMDPNVHIFV